MNDLLLKFLVATPHRLTAIGRAVYRFAAFQVLAGVIAQVVTSALRRSHPDGGYRWLNEVWPDLWTWWIPETVVGMIAVTLLAAIGLATAYGGRQVERQWV